ncbi:diguanylate cyclase [Natronospira sp.]|uniref:diguanylate cyclase n=1 Tax=Natronospira sp. TaxID=2024970 RepID=UPI003872F87A
MSVNRARARHPIAPVLLSCFLLCPLITPLAKALPLDIPAHHLEQQRWAVADGMPQTTGQTVIQSRSGAMWIGTQNGLSRFDGVEFENFMTEDHPGLRHGYINALLEDDSGRLWIGTERGLSIFVDGEFHSLDAEQGTGPVRDIVEANDQGVWLAADNGLYRATPDRLVQHPDIDSSLFSLLRDDDARLYIGGRGHLWRLADGELEHFPSEHSELELRDMAIRGDKLLLGSSDGLWALPLAEPERWPGELLLAREVERLLVDQAGSLWAASVSGLYRYAPDAEQPQPIVTTSISEAEWLRDLTQDHEGNLWIGTQARGLVRLTAGPFQRFGERDGLIDDIIWAMFEDPEGHVWAGTNEYGAYRMREDRFEQFASPEELPHAMTMGFLLDSQDRFWIATRGGVAWYDWPGLEPLPVPEELPTGGIFGITEDRDGRIWLATREGLYWWREGELQRIDESRGLSQQRTRDVLEDSQGRIWVATDTGVFRGDAEGVEPVAPESSLHEFSASALFELDGTVWAMLQGALARFPDDDYRLYPDGRGLRATVSSFMALDGDGHVWTTTHEGIQRIPLRQFDEVDRGERELFEATLFGRLGDPVPAQCNGGHGQAGLFQSVSNRFWCPSLEGALSLDLSRASTTPPAPLPRLRSLRSGGQIYPLDFKQQASVKLPPEARDLEVDFSGLQFRHPRGVNYRYRLQGFDQDWQEVGERRTAFYTNLPPGEYRFELHARNERGVESTQAAELELYLSPRIHETQWFQLLVGLTLLLLAYLAWSYSVRRLRQRRMVLERMVRKRTRQLNELNTQLQEASVTDPLTGLRNRRYLNQQLPHDIAQVERAYTRSSDFANRDITFLMVDLDHFKRINDQHGHRAGDRILEGFAEILASQVRESDYVIRWGGEEFLVVARHSEREQAAACADRIIRAVRKHRFELDEGELQCSCSIGVACYPALPEAPDALAWEEVLEIADAANYIAKEEGRDRWVQIIPRDAAREVDFMQRFRQTAPTAMAASGDLDIRRERSPQDE